MHSVSWSKTHIGSGLASKNIIRYIPSITSRHLAADPLVQQRLFANCIGPSFCTCVYRTSARLAVRHGSPKCLRSLTQRASLVNRTQHRTLRPHEGIRMMTVETRVRLVAFVSQLSHRSVLSLRGAQGPHTHPV